MNEHPFSFFDLKIFKKQPQIERSKKLIALRGLGSQAIHSRTSPAQICPFFWIRSIRTPSFQSKDFDFPTAAFPWGDPFIFPQNTPKILLWGKERPSRPNVFTAHIMACKGTSLTMCVQASGKTHVQVRYPITGGCDTDQHIVVAAIYQAVSGDLEAREFRQHREAALWAAEWFRYLL